MTSSARSLTTHTALGPVAVAVANAGFGVMGEVARLTLDDYRRQFETNVFGVPAHAVRHARRSPAYARALRHRGKRQRSRQLPRARPRTG